MWNEAIMAGRYWFSADIYLSGSYLSVPTSIMIFKLCGEEEWYRHSVMHSPQSLNLCTLASCGSQCWSLSTSLTEGWEMHQPIGKKHRTVQGTVIIVAIYPNNSDWSFPGEKVNDLAKQEVWT